MIKVTGIAKFELNYSVEVEMTEEEWDALSEQKQNEIIDENIAPDDFDSAEMDDCDVYNVVTI